MSGPNMAGQNTIVFGFFKTTSRADKAVSRLTSAGFSNHDVSMRNSPIDDQLSDMGIPERYEEYLKAGGILLAVHCSNSLEIDRANIILKQNGAEHISSTDEQGVSPGGVRRQ